MKHIRYLSVLTIIVLSVGFSRKDQVKLPVILKSGNLTAAFADNRPYGDLHKGWYNGISELRHKAQDSTLFVPFYAGFNLEHVFGGDVLDPLFEPRVHPMELKKISKKKVSLHQDALPLSHVETTTTFEMAPPHYIDVTVKYVIHDASFFRHGYAGLFWASYINRPQDKRIFFTGHARGGSGSKWIGAYSPEHGYKSGHLEAGDDYGMYAAPDFNITLASHNSDYVYEAPFYYGRFHNMVFACLFDVPEGQILRFAQSPTGGGETNPAWDFYILNPDFKTGKEYSFRVRLVYKPFVSREDIRDEYERWKGMMN